jgi:hypothetical protein
MACKAGNPPKTGKTQNKMILIRRGPPVFLPKRPKKGPFLLSVRFLGVSQAILGLDGEELTQISKNSLFAFKISAFSFQFSAFKKKRRWRARTPKPAGRAAASLGARRFGVPDLLLNRNRNRNPNRLCTNRLRLRLRLRLRT